jgi:hypothetical protein
MPRTNDGTEKIYLNSFTQDGALIMELDRLARWDFETDGDESPVILDASNVQAEHVDADPPVP